MASPIDPHRHDPDAPAALDRDWWEAHHRAGHRARDRAPSPHLVAAVEGVAPGRALDVGTGEGFDATWLAARGWEVTAVDISAEAVERARARAAAQGDDVAARITWIRDDATEWEPPDATFDLVTLQYVHVPGPQQRPLHRRCARAVAPGGLLVIADHHVSDAVDRSNVLAAFFEPEDLERDLAGEWEVRTGATVERPSNDPGGHAVDTVLVARRRRQP